MTDEQIEALWLRVTGFVADGDPADIIGFARALLADGGKGEAVDTGHRQVLLGYDNLGDAIWAAPQAECAPRSPYGAPFTTDVEQCCGDPSTCNDPCEPPSAQAECAPRDSNESAYQRGYLDGMAKGRRDAQIDAAECAPREAQPVAWCRRDTVFDWKGQLLNVAWMFPSPKGLRNPIPLYAASTPDVTGMRTVVHQIVALEPLKHPDNMENAVRILSRVIAAPTPEHAQESAGVRLTPEQSGAIQIAISILTPEYLLTANRLRSIVATIDAELAKKEGA